MNQIDPLQRAIEIVGSATALAAGLGITKGAVSQWKEPERKIPAEHCPTIERLTDGEVTCEQLRPDVDWAVLRASNKTHIETKYGRRKEDKRIP